MMNPKKRFIIKKVPLYTFMNLLHNLYMDGADFVDLHGEVDSKGTQDNVTVSVPLDYMSKDERGSAAENENVDPPPGIDEEEEAQAQFSVPLTEEDIKKLLNNV